MSDMSLTGIGGMASHLESARDATESGTVTDAVDQIRGQLQAPGQPEDATLAAIRNTLDGRSAGERQDIFNSLAQSATGGELATVSRAVSSNANDAEALNHAVQQFAPSEQVRSDYEAQSASRSNAGNTGGTGANTPAALLKAARNAGEAADQSQFAFRAARQNRANAAMSGNASAQSAAAGQMMKHAGTIVLNRNQELKHLGGFVASADVSTPHDGTYFWSGDSRDSAGNVTHSAMTTAQHLAAQSGGSTVEMTPGGKQLDRYAGGADSFNYLKERFQYTTSGDRREPQALRENLIVKGARNAGKNVQQEMGAKVYNQSSVTDKAGNQYGPLARPGSAAGALWDVTSTRFARQATGHVEVVHAASKNDPYFSSEQYANSTWMTKEKPTLTDQGKTTLNERFGEDLKGQLQGPNREEPAQDWTGTGGFKGNLRTPTESSRPEIDPSPPRAKL